LNHTTRNFPRSLREAFPHDYSESAMGIEQPIEVGPRPWWTRLARVAAEAWRFLMQRSPF
jgi:hypothetical protein